MQTYGKGKVVFIAHPYRGDVEANLKKVEEYIRYAIDKGFYPCCPWYAMVIAMDDASEEQRTKGLEANFAILARCDELWVCGDAITPGIEEEINHAEALKLLVAYVDLDYPAVILPLKRS